MAENKFIKHLKGEQTAGSLLEIKNQNTPASFGNMPQGTSDSNVKYSDVRGDVTVVANGTTAWKLNDSALTLAPIVNGDGTDYTGKYEVSGAGLWVNSTYTFPSTGDPNHPVAMIFNPNSKWVLKLCGDNLIVNDGNILELTVVITIGSSNIISKKFTIREQANQFCKELVIDFDESSSALIKASGLSTMQLQVLCGTADASARIYNGMTTLTVLQRKVDAAVVSGAFANVEEVLRDGILPSDYFNNAAYIAQIEDGDSAYAVFTRDGDTVALSGWAQPIPDQTNNAGKFLTTDGSLMSWAQLTISDVDGLSTELNDLQDQIDDLSGRGRFLALWNCATGLAESNPPESPYLYKAGDYFVVGTVSSADPAVNYKPDGSSYTTGVASTTVETNEVSVNDTYFYDGTVWKLQSNAQKEVSFSALAGSPYDNTNLSNALNAKQDTLTAGTGIDITSATISNSGVRSVSSGTTNGTISVNTNGTSADVAVYGLGSAAYTSSSDYATSAQGAKADTALQTGDNVSELANDAGYLVMGDLTGFVTRTTAQTISGLKTFTADIVLSGTTSIKNTTSGVSYTMLYRDTSGIHVGTSTQALLLAGSNARPKFNNNDIAMLSDIPTAVSQLTNDTGFITNAVNDLQNYTLTSNLATVATTGDYDDLLNKPTIPAAQVNSDWNANSGVAQILNKPTLATVATSGSYTDLSNKPTIPTVNNPTITITQGGVTKGSFTLNQASDDTIDLDAGGSGGYHPDLFDVKWSDHQINDIQWLRGDTFSWQDGSVYEAAYQHLVDDISGKSLQTETVAGTTISFYLADDGHKICPDTQASNVSAIFTATGVAWYYILDTVNQRFKLPRTQYGFTGLRDTVEKYVEAGLPNITGTICRVINQGTSTGAFVDSTTYAANWNYGSGEIKDVDIDASASNSIYGNSNSVQSPATQMYLYFYVGSFTQTAIENTAGLNASLFNGKADVDLSNTALATADYVVEKQDPTALNNYTWYRKYKSGWVEQGGQIAQSGDNVAVTLPVEMANTNYSVVGGTLDRSGAQGWRYANRTTTGFTKNLVGSTDCGGSWIVSGIAA